MTGHPFPPSLRRGPRPCSISRPAWHGGGTLRHGCAATGGRGGRRGEEQAAFAQRSLSSHLSMKQFPKIPAFPFPAPSHAERLLSPCQQLVPPKDAPGSSAPRLQPPGPAWGGQRLSGSNQLRHCLLQLQLLRFEGQPSDHKLIFSGPAATEFGYFP